METLTVFPSLSGAVMRTAQGPEDGTGFADIHQARAELESVDLYQRLGFERYKDFPRYRKAML